MHLTGRQGQRAEGLQSDALPQTCRESTHRNTPYLHTSGESPVFPRLQSPESSSAAPEREASTKGGGYKTPGCKWEQPVAPGQPGEGDAHTDLEWPQVAWGRDELPDARATAPTATRAWAGNVHVSRWAVSQALGQEEDGAQLWAIHRPGPAAPSVRRSSRLPHPKPRCLIPPVTPFPPPYFRVDAWQPLDSICPSPSALTHAGILRHFGCVQLFATIWTTACQAPLPGKNTEVGCHALLQGIFPAAPAFYADSSPLGTPVSPHSHL